MKTIDKVEKMKKLTKSTINEIKQKVVIDMINYYELLDFISMDLGRDFESYNLFDNLQIDEFIEDNDFYDSVTYLNRICSEYKLYNPLEYFNETKVKEFKSFSEYSKSENFVLNSPSFYGLDKR